jgi:hypothetical protein
MEVALTLKVALGFLSPKLVFGSLRRDSFRASPRRLAAVEIERFVWTEHAETRLNQRQLDAVEVEQAIKERHSEREANDGRAEWLVSGQTADGKGLRGHLRSPAWR